MKRSAVCLLLWLVGCVTVGLGYDESYIAHFVDGSGFVTTLTLFNASTIGYADATVTIYNDDGSLASLKVNGRQIDGPIHLVLPPGGTYALKTDGTAQALVSGWVQILADQIVEGNVLFTSPYGTAGVLESTLAQVSDVPVKVDTAANWNTGLAIANPNEVEVSVNLAILWPAGGYRQSGADLAIPAHGRVVRFLPDLFPGLPDPFEGTLQLRASNPVAATALLTGTATYAAIPVMTLFEVSDQLFDFAAVAGWISPMTVVPVPSDGYTVWLEPESGIGAAFSGNNFQLGGAIVTGSLQFRQLDGTTVAEVAPNAVGQITGSNPLKSPGADTYDALAFERGVDRTGYADGCYFPTDFDLSDIQNFSDPDALSILQEWSYSPVSVVRSGSSSITLYLGQFARPLTCGFDAATGTIQAASTAFNDPGSGALVTISLLSGSLPDYQSQARATLAAEISVSWATSTVTPSIQYTFQAVRY